MSIGYVYKKEGKFLALSLSLTHAGLKQRVDWVSDINNAEVCIGNLSRDIARQIDMERAEKIKVRVTRTVEIVDDQVD